MLVSLCSLPQYQLQILVPFCGCVAFTNFHLQTESDDKYFSYLSISLERSKSLIYLLVYFFSFHNIFIQITLVHLHKLGANGQASTC